MWAARCPLEERVYRGAGRSRRRARGDGVLVWSGVALPCLCGGSSPGLFSLERERALRESDGVTFSRSVVAPLVCKKGRVCRRTHRHGGYYDDYVIAPGSGRAAAVTARPSR